MSVNQNESADSSKFDELISAMRQGDQDAFSWFWRQYGGAMHAVALNQLSQRLQRRVGADDVVQSACRTFFRRVTAGQFELPDADSLWKLLCTITLTKARRAARDQNRKKRGQDREIYLDKENCREDLVAAGDNRDLLAVEMADQLEDLLGRLTPEECQIVDLKLQQLTNQEIAAQMQCSERTIRRLLKRIQDRWEEEDE